MVADAAERIGERAEGAGLGVEVEGFAPEVGVPAAFGEVARTVYLGDRWYVEPARGGVGAALRRGDFAGRQRGFVARLDGRPAARVVARLHPRLRVEAGRPLGLLGFFESVEAAAPAAAVLAAGLAWLRGRGEGRVVGPMDGDTWHRYRLNVGPFDEPPFLLEPYDPPWYEARWLAAGFVPAAGYHSLRVDQPRRALAALAPKAERARAAGYSFAPLDPRRFEEGLDRIYDLTVRCFHESYLYTEISRADFRALYGGSRALLDPRLVWIARDPGGEDAGFVFAYPDLVEAVRAMRGRRGPLARLRFLLRRGRARAVNVKTLGVLPEHRRSGLAAALMSLAYEGGLAAGLERANLCLIRDGNPSAALDGGAGRLLRRYRLYEHPVPEAAR